MKTFFSMMVVASAILAVQQTCNAEEEGKSLDVEIVADYDPSSSFSRSPPFYQAASALTLSCEVEELDEVGVIYEWTSTCSGNCFVRNGTNKTVSTRYLHSYDSGVHTCIVHNAQGYTGNTTITINVVGAGIYVESSDTVLPNNSLISSTELKMSSFRCLSGSSQSHVGRLIGPLGNDITFSTSDPFLISQGGTHDPGTLYVRSLREFKTTDSGIYTYRTPDENENIVDVNVGLYHYSTTSAPILLDILFSNTESSYTFTCISSLFPPTEVIWEVDGESIYFNDSYSDYDFTQTLVNRTTSTYYNTLSVNGTIEDVIGEYSCTVVNSLGSSNTLTKTIKAIRVIIEIIYSPPDQYADYSPPNYRAASSVTLRCVAIGVTGYVTYEWSSTCRYDCFASNATTETINESMLTSRDAGVHTCTVTDEEGSTGTNSTTMNIVGAGIYVVFSLGTGTCVNSQTAQPNNSYAIVDTGRSSSTRFDMYCCSNSSSSRGTFTYPNGYVYSSNYRYAYITQYTGNSTYAGCTQLYYSYRSYYSFYLNYRGIYTCNIRDSRGNNIAVSIGLYSEGFNSPPSIYQLRQTSTGTHLKLICRSHTAPPTNITWFRNDEVLDIDRNNTKMTLFGGRRSSSYFDIILTIIYDSIDSVVGTYTCQTANKFGISSKEIQAIKVTIEITYSPPDQYPDYSPPNYRAASSVTLRCVVIGTNNTVSYRWSSTCRSGCFAYNTWTQTISKNMLTSRDAGVHTCTVTDRSGDIATDNITMNIVGAGIYVAYSLGTGTSVNSQTAQPNNSYAIVDTGGSNRGSSTRFDMYCCSNSSSSIATFTLPNNAVISGNYGNIRYRQYTGSHTYAGCTQFYYYYYPYSHFNLDYTGVYTCNIGDSRGNNIAVSIGLYPEGFRALPSISLIRQVNSGTNHTAKIICTSQTAPLINITWFRNDEILDIDGNSTEMTVSVTNRRLSYFEITLTIICDSPDNIGDIYTCLIANEFGMDSEELEVQGLQIQCSSSEFIVGESVECSCSSDLDPISIEWYQGNTSLQQRSDNTGTNITIPVTTDSEGSVYTCLVESSCGTQQKTVTLNTTVPDHWADVSINTSKLNALHGSEYTLVCTIRPITGMTLPHSVEWVGPDGTVLVSEGNMTMGEVETQGTVSTLSLSFHPVLSSQGGYYTCRATVNVPWMENQPAQLSATFNMPVTTQAMFQLKLYPLSHCATWHPSRARDMDFYMRKELEKVVREHCDCNYHYTAIHSGAFSCMTSTNCSLITHATYRAIIDGSSDLLTAGQLMDILREWHESSISLIVSNIQLKVAHSEECQLSIKSFDEEEC